MGGYFMIWVMIAGFFLMMFLGVPIAFAMGAAALAFFLAKDIPLLMATQRFFSNTQSFPFLAVPFFILCGNLMVQGGIAKRIIRFADSLVRQLPGGLGLVSVVTSMLMAGVSGSSVADAAGTGSILIPSMKEKGYDSSFSCAINASTSVVGIIIPPSSTMVILGWIANLSIAKLFLGGAIPGIFISIIYFIITIYIAKKRCYPREKAASAREILSSIKDSFWALILPLFIIGGVTMGIATVTEIAAASAVYALVISILFYRSLNWQKIFVALKDTVVATSVVMFIVCCSNMFTWILIRERIPQMISSAILHFNIPGGLTLLFMVLIMLVAGMFIELVPNLFLFVPIFFPIAQQIGVAPNHFGVLMIVTLALGLFTPPVGTTLFISCHLAKIGIEDTYKDLFPFFLGGAIIVLLTAYIPSLTMWLPSLLLK
jgi:tripartite ATP-independent transporter DctM subunit